MLEDDERDARRQDDGQYHQSGHETGKAVGNDETDNGSACRTRRPVDIPSLYAHELKRPLKPLEQRVVRIAFVPAFHRVSFLAADTEKQRKCLCRRNQEDAGAHDHHDFLLEILLIVCNVLIFNIYRVSEMEKETKWKQQNQETPK